MYDYEHAVREDVKEYIENMELDEFEDREDLEEYLNDVLWTEDSVTGNASGSYTFNSYKAEENLAGNWDLVAEALEEFGEQDIDAFRKGAEFCDVTIRCYLLGGAISSVLDEMDIDFESEE